MVSEGLDPGVAVGATDEVPIFERLTAGWVNDNVGLFFLLDKVAERGNIMRLGDGSPTVGQRRTGMWPQVIVQLQNWVVMVRFYDGRFWCWGRPPCTWCGSDWVGSHMVGGRGLSGVSAEVTTFTLGGNEFGGSLGTLGEGAGQSFWKATGRAGRGAMLWEQDLLGEWQ